MAEQFTMLAEIGNWPFYWPIIALGVLIGISLFLYELVDRFVAQRRGELSNKLQWDVGYIERISKAFKNKENVVIRRFKRTTARRPPLWSIRKQRGWRCFEYLFG